MSLKENVTNLQNIVSSLEIKAAGVYEAGKKSEYDRFWDELQQNGNRTYYLNAFCGNWTDEIFKPKYNIAPEGNSQQMFVATNIKNLAACIEKAGIIFDTSKATNLAYMFNNSSTIEEVPNIDVSNSTSIGWLFNMCTSLKKASVTFGANKTTSYSNVFARCDNLEELTVNGVIDIPLSFSASSKLNTASVQSIIDHLKDLTGLTSKKIDFHTNVIAMLTDEQAASILSKNWTI